MKLTTKEREMLLWLSSTDLDVDEPTVANSLVDKGLASNLYDNQTGEKFYRITDAGRRALKEKP